MKLSYQTAILHTTSPRGVGWGITVHFYLIAFCVITIATNIIAARLGRAEVLTTAIGILIFGVIVCPTFQDYPYRTLLVLTSATGSLAVMPITLYFLRKKDQPQNDVRVN